MTYSNAAIFCLSHFIFCKLENEVFQFTRKTSFSNKNERDLPLGRGAGGVDPPDLSVAFDMVSFWGICPIQECVEQSYIVLVLSFRADPRGGAGRQLLFTVASGFGGPSILSP